MQIQGINRTDADKVFVACMNNEGSSIPADSVVQLDISSNLDGNKIVQPNTGELNAILGILDKSLADQAFGLVQVYGYRGTSIVFISDSTYPAGLKVGPAAGVNYLSSVAAGDGRDGFFVLMESIASSATSTVVSRKIHIRCM